MKLICSALCFLMWFEALAAPDVITVGEQQDASCDYHDLQSAIDSGVLNMDIRVTNQIHTANGIVVVDKPVAFLRGGYDNCADAENNILPAVPNHSTISHDDGVAMVFLVADQFGVGTAQPSNLGVGGNSDINLEISGFEVHDSLGGLRFRQTRKTGSLVINLNDLNVHHNSDVGINFQGDRIEATIQNTTVHNNSNLVGGSTQGGGIRCFDSELILLEHTAIHHNTADLGGGIYGVGCLIEAFAGMPFGPELTASGIHNNTARNFGGGMYLSNTHFNGYGQVDVPLQISNNSALSDGFLGYGGGIYFTSGSAIQLSNVHIQNNVASSRGSALTAHHFNFGLALPELTMRRDAGGCSYAEVCSVISGNQVLSESDLGAIIYLRSDGMVRINQTEISHNQAARNSGFYLSGTQSHVQLNGVLMHNNRSINPDEDAQTLFSLNGQSAMEIAYSTIADNDVATIFDLAFDQNTIQNFEIYNTIISNTGSLIVNHNGGSDDHDANIDCSLLHDLNVGGIDGNGTFAGGPEFFGNGDYQLQATSPAIDPACSDILLPTFTDLTGEDRAADGMPDLGAYETVISDLIIFRNGFEEEMK